jgi:hypothetical protein
MAIELGLHGRPVARRGRHAAPRRSIKPLILAALLTAGMWSSAVVIESAPTIAVGSGPVMAQTVPVLADAPIAGLLTVSALRLDGADPQAVATTAPVRLAFAYEGARVGTTLRAAWTVDGRLFRSLRIVLPSARGEPALTTLPPAGAGWPAGEHRIVLTSGVTPVGETSFQVR